MIRFYRFIRHDDGWSSVYAHNSKSLLTKGDAVVRGQPIALSGKSGSAQSPRLHFQLRQNTQAVDPLQHLPKS